jgi:hypothetical protein
VSTWDDVEPSDERPVDPVEEEAATVLPEQLDVPLEAPEADVVEQALEVPTDDDDE